MRRRTLLAAAVALGTLGCQANVFRTEVKGETTIEGSALGGLLNAFPTVAGFTNLDFDTNQDFKNQGVTKDQVNSVKVESIQLKILAPNDQDFSFLESLQFVARSGDRETLVAEKTGISQLALPAPNPVLVMDIKSAEIRDHVVAPSMSIIVRGKGRQPPQDTQVEAKVGLAVEVKIF